MGPQQQNSTLIDVNVAMSPSLPDEINRYSPILPPKQQSHDTNNNNNNTNNNNRNNPKDQKRLKPVQKRTAQTICNDHRASKTKAPNHDKPHDATKAKHKRHKTPSIAGGRSRSISLCGTNNTMDQHGSKEITIWLSTDEPRYISGATNKTTCNDIIKAIIDDEMQNGNYAYYNCNRQAQTTIAAATAPTTTTTTTMNDGCNGSGGSGGVVVGSGTTSTVTTGGVAAGTTASRDYSDYVLTECWRGIERSYDGRMPILPVWKAWSRVHNELRLTLKHRTDINEPPNVQVQKKSGFQTLCKYLSRIFNFGKRSKQCAKTTERAAERFLLSQKERIPDEFLFIILPENFQCPRHGKHTRSHATDADGKYVKTKFLSEKLCKLSEDRGTTKRSKRRKSSKCNAPATHRSTKGKDGSSTRGSSGSGNRSGSATSSSQSEIDHNYLKRRKDTSTRQTNVRNTLAQKTAEMNQLYEREQLLTKELTTKCKLYKLQNELYTHADRQFELSVGQIQDNVEAYAKEIIKTEQELFELKQEIKQDISLINNLKRLTLTADVNECGIMPPSPTIANLRENMCKMTKVAQEQQRLQQEMQFVDNIYEFCDNNASMLV